MNTAGLYVRMNPDIKKKAQNVASELGFSLSSLINAYVRQLVKTKQVDFSLEEEPTPYLIRAMKRAEKNLKKGNTSPIFDNIKDNLAWLKKQGI